MSENKKYWKNLAELNSENKKVFETLCGSTKRNYSWYS